MPAPPSDWPDLTASWLWNDYWAPGGMLAGTAYFRRTFNPGRNMTVQISAAADDAYELWLDGTPILSAGFDSGGYSGASNNVKVALDAGPHLLAARVVNFNDLSAGFACTVMELDAAGTQIGVVVHTDADWKILAYPPAVPGFTPGQVVRILTEEAQARGALATVALNFSDAADTAGQPWPVTAEIAADVGTDLLATLRQLAEAYFDMAMAPDTLWLSAWAARGAVTAVTFAAEVNLSGLSHEGNV